MHQLRVVDSLCDFLEQGVMLDVIEGTLDTLPTVTSTVSPSRCGLSVPNTRWRAKP
jgi:hypothetical protein